jgi:hypothetical protein
VRVGDQRHELARAHFNGTRDHHWGTRDGVGGRARWSGWQHVYSGAFVQYPDWCMWGEHVLRNLGDPKPGSETLRRRRHRLRFEPDTHLLLGGEVDVTFASGEEKMVTFTRAGNQDGARSGVIEGAPTFRTNEGERCSPRTLEPDRSSIRSCGSRCSSSGSGC